MRRRFPWSALFGAGPTAEPKRAEFGPPAPPAAAELLGALPEPALVVRDGRVLLANPAARALLGEHIVGADVRLALRHPAAAERLARGQGLADSPSIALPGLGGADRHWEMTLAPVGGDTLVRLVDRSSDIAAERMRTDFVANASHELRTPLAALLGFIETLQDAEAAADEPTRSRFLAIMESEAKRMQRLVDDLMSLSRIEADRFRPPQDSVDLRAVVEECGRNLAPLLEARGMSLAIEDETGGTLVAGERSELLQLVANLLDNAAKYGREGTPVTVRFEEAPDGMLTMRVSDRGEGIAPQHLPLLTRRFYRVDAGRSRAAGGTGLGLAIVKHIVERHRGRLDIRSIPGEGTDVEIGLPRSPALS